MSDSTSGFARILAALAAADVDFVVVGVSGINFYARTPAEAFATLDVDAFVAPISENLRRALSVLSSRGYVFEAGGEPFVDIDDPDVLSRVVANGASLNAFHDEDGQVDLMTSVSGFSYPELDSDASVFEVAGSRVRVGRLEKLLRAKEASGRPKDIEFLRAFQARDDER